MKALRFVGSSLRDLREFPDAARREAGFELDAIQRGLMPSDFNRLLKKALTPSGFIDDQPKFLTPSPA